ncbi:hypothetical protein AYO40_02375 [Planctomycetaceae bacterium SCGC AG-212-D15]|nr:hypothetical protein AYO40_02375 [Planctomycetaceae bacterium SCGC AG-212-D15]
MSSPELGECAGFVWDLQRSGLVDRARLDELLSDFLTSSPGAGPEALSEHLVQVGDLSPFQAERLMAGHGQDLVLNEYILIDAIGQGSMGTVYKALNRNDGVMCALKLLPRRSMWNVRIARRIIRAFEEQKHPAVVAFRDVGTAGAAHYLAWELAEGETLEDRVRRLGKLAPGVTALYGLHIAEGLDVLQRQDVVHGLIKPSNILVSAEHQARILDYGIGALIAEAKEESLVDTMSTANTVTAGLDCRSPETILDPTVRTPSGDQYSLGCTLYFCLTGRFPFEGLAPVQKMIAHQMKEPTPIRQLAPYVPKALVTVVERLMKKTPEERYPGQEAVVAALRPLAVEAAKAENLTQEASEGGAEDAEMAPPGSEVEMYVEAERPRTPSSIRGKPAPQVESPARRPSSHRGKPASQVEAPPAAAPRRPSSHRGRPAPQEEPVETYDPTDAPLEEPVEDQEQPGAEWSHPEYQEAVAQPNAFDSPVPLPRPPKGAKRPKRRRSPAASAGPSLFVRAGAFLVGYAVGAAVVGGAVWWMYSQGYLPH